MRELSPLEVLVRKNSTYNAFSDRHPLICFVAWFIGVNLALAAIPFAIWAYAVLLQCHVECH